MNTRDLFWSAHNIRRILLCAALVVVATFPARAESYVDKEAVDAAAKLAPTVEASRIINGIANNATAPIKTIYVGDDQSFQIIHRTISTGGQIYPTGLAAPADMGVFVRTQCSSAPGGTLYGPNFSNHGGSATGGVTSSPVYHAWTVSSLSPLSGNGSAATPWEVDVTTTGGPIRLVQKALYEDTKNYFIHDMTFTNTSASAITFDVFLASDIYLAASDAGFPLQVGNSVGGSNFTTACQAPGTYHILHIPVSPSAASHVTARNNYSLVWSQIRNGDFDDQVDSSSCGDNGAGLEWKCISLQPNASITIRAATSFGDVPSIATPCVAPPKDMVAWWPLDETSTSIAHELVAQRNGTQTPNTFTPGNFITGMVSGAYRLNSTVSPYKHVTVGDYSAFDFTSSFTIDAWVRLTAAVPAGNTRYIVTKASGSGFLLTGYQFYINDQNRLGFELGSNNLSQNDHFTNPQPGSAFSLNTWYHVAAVVTRSGGTTSSRIYVNGAPISPAYSHAGITSIVNSASLKIGSCSLANCPFLGDIDEVELFCRALSETELLALYNAGSSGKCKISCKLPGTVGFCSHHETEPVTLTLCNNTATQQSFSWSLAQLLASAACNIDGPNVFTPPSGGVLVPAFSCSPPVTPLQTINVQKPQLLASGKKGCYQATASVSGFGVVTCSGGVVPELNDALCCHPVGLTTQPIPNGGGQLVFQCDNNSAEALTLDYEISETSPSDPAYRVLSLNGLPPGTPFLSSRTINPQTSVLLAFDVAPITCGIRNIDHGILLRGSIDLAPMSELTTMTVETQSTDTELCGGCDDGNACTVDSCDAAAGLCTFTALNCDDGNACSTDACTANGVCTHDFAPAPLEVDNGVRVNRSGTTALLNWNLAVGATSSDVVRGMISALPVGPGDVDEVCLNDNLGVTSTSDAAVPAAGTGFWYLVRGGNSCGFGTLGSRASHGIPDVPRTSTTCP